MQGLKAAAVVVLGVLLSACGSGGGEGDNDSAGGGSGSLPPRSSAAECQQFFDPALMAEGQDCTAKYGQFCPLIDDTGAAETRNEVPPCDGVTVAEYPASTDDFESTYLVLTPDDSEPDRLYMALSWRNASAQRTANLLRLQELAKARNAIVVVVTAPNDLIGDIHDWPTSGIDQTLGLGDTIGMFIGYLDQVRADLDARFDTGGMPFYMSGLSNGGVMIAQYICAGATGVDAVEIVGGTIGLDLLERCEFASPIGTVQVHGTADLLTLYYGTPFTASFDTLHQAFLDQNGCGPGQQIAQAEDGIMTIHFGGATDCSGGRRSYTVSIELGGHNWPGMDTLYFNLTGPLPTVFDATIQGFDLMTLAAGE